MNIFPLIFLSYTPTSPPFLIHLFAIDFHDILYAILIVSTMCTRSLWRVMQLDAWMNAAWWSSFRQIRIVHWRVLLWRVWHQSLKYCNSILSQLYFLLSHLTVIGKQVSSLLVILPPDLHSRTFGWCVPPLHMHRRIIVSHNLVTEVKKKLTSSKIGTQIEFHWDLTSKIVFGLSIPLVTQEPSSCLHPNPISIWGSAGEAICRGKSLQVQRASLAE